MEVGRGRTSTPAWDNYHATRSPFGGRNGFGLPTPLKRTGTPRTNRTPCSAVTPRSGTKKLGLSSRRLATNCPRTQGCVTPIIEASQVAVLQAMQVQEADEEMQMDEDVDMDMSPDTTLDRINELTERALSQGMSRPGRESVTTLPECCEQLESMGVIKPSPTRNPFYCKMEDLITNSAKKESRPFPQEPLTIQKEPAEPEDEEEEEPMMEDTPLKPSARKSVTFRCPLTDEKPKQSDQEPRSPSPSVTITTPRARLSFVTDASLEEDDEESKCVYEANSPCESIITTLGNRASTEEFEMKLHKRQSVLTIVREESECSSVSEREVDDESEKVHEVDPASLPFRELQQLAKSYGVPCKGKKEQLARAVAKAIAQGPRELSPESDNESEGSTDSLAALSYREVQAKAKSMNLNAGGKKEAILSRIRAALEA